ncbi:hypothetical protein THITH_06825 [Thioalkalivibrio paradoxus ARh 1]|uniref:Uncharacterized protein n=1 Tax=Thioalkalivibrio paradoxus ARh 1 TaxID=713585 RepID=W0DNJ1_9GAMM|nr:hypothetical protein THITH_06825 [Thioalkalivibrio paradoxus ARh 1]
MRELAVDLPQSVADLPGVAIPFNPWRLGNTRPAGFVVS